MVAQIADRLSLFRRSLVPEDLIREAQITMSLTDFGGWSFG
jgi:hypothetical protein